MKRLTFIKGCATLACTTFIGCGDSKSSSSTTSSTGGNSASYSVSSENTELKGTVTVGGSTSVEGVILSAMEVFMGMNTGVTITYDATGSSTGVKSAASGDYDIGLASRDVKESETADLGAIGTVFAIDGIAIVVNPANTVKDLALEKITAIADGTVTNWSEVGGEDQPITLIGREAGSGTRDGFESIVGVDECVYEQELSSTGAVIAAVQSNPYAIGYASVSAVTADVVAITVDGIEATEENIKNGSYKVQRNFNFVTVDGKELSTAAQAFYDFVLSEDASALVIGAGAVPVV